MSRDRRQELRIKFIPVKVVEVPLVLNSTASVVLHTVSAK